MLSLDQYRYDGSEKVKLEKAPTSARALGLNREQVVEQTQQNKLEIASLQDRLYAEGQEGVVVIFQAMDAAGKDSAIKHVMSAVNPRASWSTVLSSPPAKTFPTIFCGGPSSACPPGAAWPFSTVPIMKTC